MADYSLENFKKTEQRIRAAGVLFSPVKRSTWLSNLIEGNVYLKLDVLQQGNSFKLRGATNYLLSYLEKYNKLPTKIVVPLFFQKSTRN